MKQTIKQNTEENKEISFSRKEKFILFTLASIMLLELIDTSVLNTALPQIAFDFHINPIQLKIAVTIYLLTLGMLIPCATWVADRFGIVRVLFISIIGFLVSSIFCGLSTGVISLVVARAFQGAFGAFAMPVGRLIMVRLFPDRLVTTLSFMATIIVIGPLLGPIIGGAVTTWLNWRVIFFINIPIGLFSLFCLNRFFPKMKRVKPEGQFNYLGFILLSIGLVLLLSFLDTLVDDRLSATLKLSIFAISLLSFISYFFHARKKRFPIIKLQLFKEKVFQFFIIQNSLMRLFLMGFPFLFPLFLQTKFHYSAFSSGMTLFPMLIGSWLSKQTVKPLLKHLLYQKFIIILLSLIFVLNILIAITFLYFNLIIFIILSFFIGWSISGLITILNTGVYKGLSEENVSAGTTINSAVIQLGSSFAIAIIATVLIASSGNLVLDWNTALPNISYASVKCSSNVADTSWLIG